MKRIKCHDCSGYGTVDYGDVEGGRETCRTCKGTKYVIVGIRERPDLTEKYCAIDGIVKHDRNFTDGHRGGQFYDAREDAIRPDILEIFKMPNSEYNVWRHSRFEATSNLLEQWELFASIPCLNYGDKQYNMDAMTSLSTQLKYLRDGLDYLKKIDDLRNSMKVEGD